MKRTFLFFFTLVVATMSIGENDFEMLAKTANMSREEVQTCVNQTSVTAEDIMHYEQIVEDDLNTLEFDDNVLKVGCFFACIAEKKEVMTGARVNMDKIKEILRAKSRKKSPDKLAIGFQILDTCNDRVKDNTNKCEVTLKLLFCVVHEIQKYLRSNNNINE